MSNNFKICIILILFISLNAVNAADNNLNSTDTQSYLIDDLITDYSLENSLSYVQDNKSDLDEIDSDVQKTNISNFEGHETFQNQFNVGEPYSTNTRSSIHIIDDSNFDTYFDREGLISYDVEANSIIYFGNLSNRFIKLDIPLTVSSLEGTTIFNSTIEITGDASTSTLKDLNFFTNATRENSNYLAPIYINQASDLTIENNFIYIDYYDGCNYNLAGIYAFGASNNNSIRNNRISIYSKSSNNSIRHYIYGIDFSSYASGSFSADNALGNIISSNIIDILSDYYANGITLSCAADTKIDNNNIILKSNSFCYGIVSEFFNNGYDLTQSNNFILSKNIIEACSNMVYGIQIFNVYGVNISGNTIKSNSNASYGISAYGSHDHILENNDIIVNGIDISSIGTNFDSIGTGHSGIYYTKDSYNLLIKNNKILSYYALGGDYAIKFDSSSTYNITVIYNNISSTTLHGDNSVSYEKDVIVHDNNPYNTTSAVMDYTIFNIFVDTNGNDNSGNGSSDNPFLTIYKALTYLKSLNMDSGSNFKVKGIIHIGEGIYTGYGSNLRLVIADLNVDIVGTGYNKTVIDGASAHWFFEISQWASVSIQNISFVNGVYRQNGVGLIFNKGNLSLENCIFNNSKVPKDSAVIYNEGILRLKNNYLGNVSNGHIIYNKGFVDGLYLNFIKDSLDENERIMDINSNRINLTAYVHDDNGNPISGGYVRFFIEGREILVNASLDKGIASIFSYSSLNGIIKISGFYLNAYTNVYTNMGKVNNSLISSSIVLYVNNSKDSLGDGTLNNPFNSINYAFNQVFGTIEPVTIVLLENSSEDIDSSLINSDSNIIIKGSNENIYISSNWVIDTKSQIILEDLIFKGYYLVKFNADLTISNCLFTQSPTKAIYSVNGSLTILNSNFTYNNIKEDHSVPFEPDTIDYLLFNVESLVHQLYVNYERGGAIYNNFSNLTILDCNFISNEAYNGGAIFNEYSDLHISNTNFLNNLAFDGFNDDSTATKGGAILQVFGKEVIITDCLFSNNAAEGIGGAFYSIGFYPNVFDGFNSNIAGYPCIVKKHENDYINQLGEIIENLESPQDIYFINCTFDSNLAPRGGGAIYIVNNSLTSYISCNFLNNMVFTYDISKLFGGNAYKMRNWLYIDELENVYSIFFHPVNNGGAIHDNNLKIIDSTFSANTLESGGSIILPTLLTYGVERNNLSKSNVGISVVNSVSGSDSIYVADSSLLTAEDSSYLGINGWVGSYDGPSISRLIPENSNSPSSGGDGTGGNGNGQGNGNGNGGTLDWGDIIGALGGNSGNIAISGDGSGLSDLINKLLNGNGDSSSSSNSTDNNSNSKSNDTETNSHNSIKVDGTSDITVEDAGGLNDDGGSPSNVGTSSTPLSGEASDSSADSSDSSSSSPGESGSSASSSKAYMIYKNETDSIVQKNVNDYNLVIIIIIFFGLIILGYYRESRKDEDKKGVE
ncbi:MAG: hypothetical protein E7Z75_00530 [Methanobrevibacter olleyae]|uniref:Adhesin-like protein n=1 Tax=Methanobrevibacter olleyae TaxID=294671 RepID=A0A8T3VKG5_METOL|nr:hypothetical protein [Methanobrevibacter olleyae]